MPVDLWRFAEDYYRRPGVEAACLQLQACGADVCLLICGIWLEHRGVACSAARVERLRALATPWREQVVARLRQLRQDWRGAAADDCDLAPLREAIKRLELEAERVQLQRLESASLGWPADAAAGEDGWLRALVEVRSAADREALRLLRRAARPA